MKRQYRLIHYRKVNYWFEMRRIRVLLCKSNSLEKYLLLKEFLIIFRRLLEGEVRRPLLFSPPEPTDTISLTHSEPFVSFIIVYLCCDALIDICFVSYLCMSLHVSPLFLYLTVSYWYLLEIELFSSSFFKTESRTKICRALIRLACFILHHRDVLKKLFLYVSNNKIKLSMLLFIAYGISS